MLANCPQTGAKTRQSMLTQNDTFQFQSELCFGMTFCKKKKKIRRPHNLSMVAALNNLLSQ